jgi:hypothetical protein
MIRGQVFPLGIVTNEASYVRIRPVAEAFGWSVRRAGGGVCELTIDGAARSMPLLVIGADGYVPCRPLAEGIGAGVAWDADSRTVTIG